MSATTQLGKVSVTPQGAWSSSTAYAVLDIVTNGGGSYIAKQAVPAGTALSNTSYWLQITEKGATGGVSENAIASTYSATSTYAVGDYVIYNDLLYRCIVAITTAEAWTAAHWTSVALGDEVENAKEDISIVISDLNFLNSVAVSLDVYVNKNGVETSNDSFCSFKEIDVSDHAGDKIYILGTGFIDAGIRAYTFYDEDKVFISGGENVYPNNSFVVPVNAYYMTVSIHYSDVSTKSIPSDSCLTIKSSGKNEFNTSVGYQLIDIVKPVVETRNLVYGKHIIPRFYINGSTVGDSDYFFSVKDISVEGGVTYYIHCDASNSNITSYADARFVTEYDSSGAVVKTTPYVSGSITVSSTTTSVAITFYYLEAYPTANTGYYYFSAYPYIENSRLINDSDRISKNAIDSLEIFNEETRKGVICFTFDDGVTQDSQLVSIFDDYGAKCGFALISTILSDSSNRIVYYRNLYRRGFSILCHSNNGDNMGDSTSFSEAELLVKMRDTRVAFSKFGIKTNGWVTPSSYLKRSYIPTLQKFYSYGYTTYFGAYTDPTTIPYDDLTNTGYLLKRVHIGTTTIANLKTAVDECIENNGLLSFYGHGYELDDGTLDASKLKELLAYIKNKEKNLECHLYSPDDAMTYYFRPRHNDS